MQAMFVVKLLTVLVAAAALANVVCERRSGKNLVEVSRRFTGKAITWMHGGHLRGQRLQRAPPPLIRGDDEEEEHRHEWGIDEKSFTIAVFNRSMFKKMAVVRDCHKACGMEVACHQKCPEPWAHLAEKCREVAPRISCQDKCKDVDDQHACLMRCPAVQHPTLVDKVRSAMECHRNCGRFDRDCHASCPKPMERLRGKCSQLHQTQACHEKCRPDDLGCHHQCPKFVKVWQHPPLKVRDAEGAAGHRRAWGVEHTPTHNATMAFHRVMRERMSGVRACHAACGHNIACHDKCPKPWSLLAEKCHKAEPIIACHKSCTAEADPRACHAQCPLPQSPLLATRAKLAAACHHKCSPHDHQCHRSCLKPMESLTEKCGKLHETLACHAGCNSDDLGCHHRCPKFMKLWLHSPTGTQETGEVEQHHRDWGFSDNATDNATIFHHIMRERMGAMRGCHVACDSDGACHERCPKPWSPFAQKCQKMTPVIACHENCQHAEDRTVCHVQCPMPDDTMLGGQARVATDCHKECGSDRRCHHSCPKHFEGLSEKCSSLHRVTACHEQCRSGDIGCHHQCPKFAKLWQHLPMVVEEGEEAEEHRREWGFESSPDEGEQAAGFEQVMHAKMHELGDCHKRCGKDGDCHAKCPTPWTPFAERCHGAAPIIACHHKCSHATDEHACHSECAMPQGPLSSRMKLALECHSKCNRFDHRCHHSCPKPMQQLMQRCGELHQTLTCHGQCSLGDTRCHKACPRFMRLWQRKAA